ncbi:MAG: hypothetical protein IJR93_07205 [Treponema sp.]|nr:hypothetical protein [Treponema sp.]MBQ7166712.1 hypothetical protein [Treponema sp.]
MRRIDTRSAVIGGAVLLGALVVPVVSDWFAPIVTNIREKIQGMKSSKA